MSNPKLTNGILNVLIANICNLIFSVLTSFLLPRYLSVDTYASIKTFQMYLGYVGLLHFGYIDGMYIRNGGKSFNELKDEELQKSLSTLRTMQISISIVLVLLCFIIKDITFFAFTLTVIPLNMTSYFKALFQSIGEFKRYSNLIQWTSVATFILNILLLLIIRSDCIIHYLLAYIILYYLIWLVLEFKLQGFCSFKYKILGLYKNELINNIKDGFLLTLGNLSSFFFTGMDRWFVKILLKTIDFAQYSFAVSIEHFVNITLTPVSVTLYNYFCKNSDSEKIKKIRCYVLLIITVVIASAFPAKFILEHFLVGYIEAGNVIFLLFSAQIFHFTIQSVYINLYKARKNQKVYFVKMIIAIAAGFVLNVMCFLIIPCREAFAIGTVIASACWWALCLPDFKDIPYNKRELLYLMSEILLFNLCGFLFDSILGFAIYMMFTIIMAYVCLKNELMELIHISADIITDKIDGIRKR